MFDVDLFVIGGGSGGVRAARMAAASGARVALAEESRMGGTCVIRGCVPKKLMVFASSFAQMPQEARAYGWDIPDGAFHWAPFRAALFAELDRLEGVYNRLLDGSGVTVYAQRAKLIGAHQVALADGQTITAKRILIATGGRPVRPDLPNADLGMISDDVFEMEALPQSIVIVGGGFIACEMACIFHGLGVKVTQIYRGSQILRGFDTEAAALIAQDMRARGIDLRCDVNILRLDGEMGAIKAALTTGEVIDTHSVLFATGRTPNTAGLGLEALGVRLGHAGEITVDAYNQTSVPSVYAVGDVTNRVNLTPVAIREAMAFNASVFLGQPTPADHDLIPMAVFTQPELGAIGLTEDDARAQEPIDVYATTFRPMRSAFAGGQGKVLLKLIVSQATRKVLGCHIVAPDAGEMIQLVGVAVKMGATKEDFDRVVAVHPTMAEELVTMRHPARSWPPKA